MLQRQSQVTHNRNPNIFNLFKPHNNTNPFQTQQQNHAYPEGAGRQHGRILGGRRNQDSGTWQPKKQEGRLISEQSVQMGIEVSQSVEESERVSQVLSINQFGGEEHPMFLYNIHSQEHRSYNRFAFSQLKIAVSELHRTFLELTDFVYEQRELWLQMQKQHSAQLIQFANRFVMGIAHKGTQRQSCGKCRQVEAESAKKARTLQEQVERLSRDNEELQEYIFDLEQKVVGIDLEVQRKLQERTKSHAGVCQMDAQGKNMVASLQKEIKQLKSQSESIAIQEKQLKEREGKVYQSEKSIIRRENIIKENLKKLEQLKQNNFQREREILDAQDNLSKKISQLRAKQYELSQWQANLTQKLKNTRDRYQFPSNSPSFQNSEQLNQSGISLKSFGRNKAVMEEQLHVSSDNYINNNIQEYTTSKKYEHDLGRRSHEKSQEHNEYLINNSREIAYNGRKHAHRHSHFRDSSETSPYKHGTDLTRKYANLQQSRNSPLNYRDTSKNSRKSQSRVRPLLTASSRLQRAPQLGGLGSKLQRLREQIKKEIDSIK